MQPDISIVIPMWNKVDYIESTLNSILYNSNIDSTEVIIIDDGSTDGSSEIAMDFERRYPNTFFYCRLQPNGDKNPCRPRNFGTRIANGRYITYFDADDILMPGYFDRACRYLDEHQDISLYIESFYYKYGSNYDKIEWSFDDFLSLIKAGGCHCKHIFRTDLVKEMDKSINLFDVPILEDCLFTLKYISLYQTLYISNEIGWLYLSETKNSLAVESHNHYNAGDAFQWFVKDPLTKLYDSVELYDFQENLYNIPIDVCKEKLEMLKSQTYEHSNNINNESFPKPY